MRCLKELPNSARAEQAALNDYDPNPTTASCRIRPG